MTPDHGSTRKRQIGGTKGGNKNQKTKRSNENRQKTQPGERSEEDAAGRDKAPELHDRRQPKKTEPKRHNGQIASICQTKEAPARKKRASIQDVDPRTRRATETTQRATGYNPPAGRGGRHPGTPGYRQKNDGGGATCNRADATGLLLNTRGT